MTTAFVDYNGVVPEKWDAVNLSHLVDAEYGNQGIDFKCVPREGFGWMNGKCSSARYANVADYYTTQPRTRSDCTSSPPA